MSRLRILLDECIDRRLANELSAFDVRTVPEETWAGLKNGVLLNKAQDTFDVFITVDRNLAFQQNIPSFSIAVLVLHARTNRFQDLLPLIPAIHEALQNLQPGVAVTISG